MRRTCALRVVTRGSGVVEVLKVSSRSSPNAVAGALAGAIRVSGAVEIQVVGAGALNQAIKAVAIARGFVVPSGLDLACRPTFTEVEIDGETKTAIRLLVESHAGLVVQIPGPADTEPVAGVTRLS